ncbi:hypothetical protein WJX79_003632 [Trebouxia sp. C0005]
MGLSISRSYVRTSACGRLHGALLVLPFWQTSNTLLRLLGKHRTELRRRFPAAGRLGIHTQSAYLKAIPVLADVVQTQFQAQQSLGGCCW